MRTDMAAHIRSLRRKIWQALSSIKTGVVLLITVVVLSAAGTIVLQRPVTDPDEMQRAYSPQVLRILDAVGLTDVFHAWWFVALMILVSLSIIAASIERFPNAWRYSASPPSPQSVPPRPAPPPPAPTSPQTRPSVKRSRYRSRSPLLTRKLAWWPPSAHCTDWDLRRNA